MGSQCAAVFSLVGPHSVLLCSLALPEGRGFGPSLNLQPWSLLGQQVDGAVRSSGRFRGKLERGFIPVALQPFESSAFHSRILSHTILPMMVSVGNFLPHFNTFGLFCNAKTMRIPHGCAAEAGDTVIVC